MEEMMGEASNIRRYEKRCIHAAECVRGLPAVFDSKAKPWIRPAETEADVLAPVIARCPSGALKLERADGTSEPVPTRNTATLTRDGPTYLRGDIELVGADGTVAMIDTRMALCRCGASQNKPLCDGSHRAAGFRHPGTVLAGETPPSVPAAGRLTIRQRPNGPLMCTGPLSVVGMDGRAAYA